MPRPAHRRKQGVKAGLVAIYGREDQGGPAVGPCLIWVRLCLEQGAQLADRAPYVRADARGGGGEMRLGDDVLLVGVRLEEGGLAAAHTHSPTRRHPTV